MSLFDRLRKKTPAPETDADRIRSVVAHLKKMLNTRQGSTLMDPEYGMPDFTDLRATYPDSVKDIESSISKAITRYEPRVTNVHTTFMYQDEQTLTLYFQIRASLKSEQDDISIYLESTLDAGGKMAVRG